MHRDDPPRSVADARAGRSRRARAASSPRRLAKDPRPGRPTGPPAPGAAHARRDGDDAPGARCAVRGSRDRDPPPPRGEAQAVADRPDRGGRGCSCWSPAARSRSSSPTTARAAAPPRPPGLTLPSVPSAATSTAPPTTVATTTAAATTTAPTTTAPPPTTTAPTTTAATTTPTTTTAPTTTAPPPTTTAPPPHHHSRHDDRHDADDDRPGHDPDDRPVRALYFGTYDRAHPRNVNAIAALRGAGVEVEERQVPVRGGGLLGALNVFAAEWRLLAPRKHDFDVVIVGYPGHFDVPRARRFAGRRPLVFDAVLSLENELVDVRRHFRDRSTAATVLRVVDFRAFRLPEPRRLRHRRRGPLPRRSSEPRRRPQSFSVPTRTSSARRGRRPIRSRRCRSPMPRPESCWTRSRSPRPRCGSPSRARSRPDSRGIALAHAGIVLAGFHDSRAIPAVVFEALATGAPVITADTDAARELLTDGDSAVLVEPESPTALARRSTCSRRTSRCAGASRRGAGRSSANERAAACSASAGASSYVRRWGSRYAHSPSESSVAASSSSQAASASGQITYQPIRYGSASSSRPNARPSRARPRAASRSSQT